MDFWLIIFCKSLVLSWALFWVFFVGQSPIFAFFRRWVLTLEQKLKTSGKKIRSWIVNKFNYAYNCAFCLPGWIMIGYFCFYPSWENFWCMLSAPSLVLLMWANFKSNKKVDIPKN